jgi:hypothetical protein
MSEGRVASIYIGPEPEGPMQAVQGVVAVAGRGLEGDRYFQPGERDFFAFLGEEMPRIIARWRASRA